MKKNESCGCQTSANQVVCQFGIFSKEEFELHRKETVDLLKESSSKRAELDDGFSFTFTGDEQLFVRLANWVSREHLCCPWANFRIEIGPFNRQMSQTSGTIVLTITGGGERGKQVLLEGFKILKEGGI